MAKRPTIEHLDTQLARWKTRLRRAFNTVEELEKQRKRMVTAAAKLKAEQAEARKKKPAADSTAKIAASG